jgi:hypothetical protein
MKNKYEIRGDVTAISIYGEGRNHETLVDTKRLVELLNIECTIFFSGGYAVFSVPRNNNKQKKFRLHRYLTNAEKGYEVDHINHEKLDNRLINLRVVTKSINQQNRRNPKNVAYDKRSNLYYAYVTVNKKRHYSRYFKTEEEAVDEGLRMRAAIQKESYLHMTNPIDESEIDFQGKEKPRSTNKTSGIRFISLQTSSNKWRVKVRSVVYGDFSNIEDAKIKLKEVLERLDAV